MHSPGNPWSQSWRRKRRQLWEGLAEMESFKHGMKDCGWMMRVVSRVDGKLTELMESCSSCNSCKTRLMSSHKHIHRLHADQWTDWLSALNMYCELVHIVTVCASRQACTVACSWTRLSSVSPLGRCQLALSFTRLLSRDNHLRTSTAQQHTHLVSPISHNQALTSYLYILQAVVKVENLRWGNSIFSVGPKPRRQGPSDANASEYSMPYLPETSICHQLFCTDVIICNCSVSPTVLCISTNLEMQERCLPIIRGAGTPFPCAPRHFNHCLQGLLSSQSSRSLFLQLCFTH